MLAPSFKFPFLATRSTLARDVARSARLPRRRRAGIWAALLSFLLAGCADSSGFGHLVIVVDVSAQLRDSVTEVRVDTPSGSHLVPTEPWPRTLTLYGRPGQRGTITVSARGGAAVLASRTASVVFPSGRRVWSIFLSDACKPGVCAATQQVCGDCGECVDRELDGDSLPRVSSEAEARRDHTAPACGRDGGPALDSSAGDAGPDAGDVSGEAAFDIDAPDLVATDSCVPVNVVRSGNVDAEAQVPVSAELGALYAEAGCVTPITELVLAAGDGEATMYYRAPDRLGGAREVQTTLHAAEVAANLGLRVRAVALSRGWLFGCALLADGQVQCSGWGANGRLGLVSDAKWPTPVAAAGGADPAARMFGDGANTCFLHEGALGCFGDAEACGTKSLASAATATPVTPTGLGADVIDADMGGLNACAVKADHTLYCWGRNQASQCAAGGQAVRDAQPLTLLDDAGITSATTTVQACAAADAFNCALLSTGAVYCWGEGYASPTLVVASKATKLSATRNMGCAVIADSAADDDVTCWKKGEAASLIAGLPEGRVELVAAGPGVGCAVIADDAYCWGNNVRGWLGTKSLADPLSVATRVELPRGDISALAIAWSDGPALSAIVDGLVYAWGMSRWGDLGLDARAGVIVPPVPVPSLAGLDIESMAIGAGTSCAVLTDHTVRCWGAFPGNGVFDLELGSWGDAPAAPAALPSDGGFTQVVVGENHVFALRPQGDGAELYAWGANSHDELGQGASGTHSSEGAAVSASAVEALPGKIVQVSTGAYGSYLLANGCARLDTGAVYCWGGWPPDDHIFQQPTQVVEAGQKTTDLSGSCALIDGVVECWYDSTFARTKVAGFDAGVEDIEASSGVVCGQTADVVYCAAGFAEASQVFSNVSEVRAGRDFACALTLDSKVSCAGSNEQGQLGRLPIGGGGGADVVSGLSDVSQLAVGPTFSCALAAGAWKCWGQNENGNMALVPYVYDRPTLLAPWAP